MCWEPPLKIVYTSMKKKGKRMVPNCVPESVQEAKEEEPKEEKSDDKEKLKDEIAKKDAEIQSLKVKAEKDFLRTGAADFGDSIQAEGARRAVVRQLMKNNPNEFMLPPETLESIVTFKDLQRGGSNFPDPLTVFRNVGNFTRQELDQIDEVIQRSPFDDIGTISERVFEFIGYFSRPTERAKSGKIQTKTLRLSTSAVFCLIPPRICWITILR